MFRSNLGAWTALFLVFIPALLPAQPEGFPDLLPLFQPEKIAAEKVLKAEVIFSVKYDRQPIRESKRRMVVLFFPDGRPARVEYITDWMNRTDTIVEQFEYDREGRLIQKRIIGYPDVAVEQYGYRQDYLSTWARFQLPESEGRNARPGHKHLVWMDSLIYREDKVEYYNQNGLAYQSKRTEQSEGKQIISTYDQSGKLLRRDERITGPEGRLIEESQHNMNRYLFNWRKQFTYDEQGRLAEEQYYRDGKPDYIRRISYFPNGLPELDITRYEETGRMVIGKIIY